MPKRDCKGSRTLNALEMLWRQTRRSIRKPFVFSLPEEHAEGYERLRIKTFRHRVAVAANVINGAMIVYGLLSAFIPALGDIPLKDLYGAIASELIILLLSRPTTRLIYLQMLGLATGYLPLVLFTRLTGIEDANFLMVIFGMGFLYPWNVVETALVSAIPFMGFVISRSGIDANGHVIFYLAIFIMTGFQFIRERERRLTYILETEAAEAQARLVDSLRLAAKLHDDIISGDLDAPTVTARVEYEPMEHLGGDYVKIAPIDADRTVIVISDVTGHGAPAALMINRINAVVETIIASGTRPGHAAAGLSSFVSRTFAGTGMLMSTFWGEYNALDGRIRWTNYGHPSPILYSRRTGTFDLLKGTSPPMGLEAMDAEPENEMAVEAGDLILFYTDGLIEFDREEGNLDVPSLVRLLELYVAKTDEPGADDMIAHLREFVHSERIGPAKDDLLMAVWEIRVRA